MHFFQPPPLHTLDSQPSWHNRAGRTDRSACAELRPKDVLSKRKPKRDVLRTRIITITLPARRLARILDTHLPYELQGDRRTTKSNAMRTHLTRAPTTNHARIHEGLFEFGNPNKGAPRIKFLGLWHDWKQTLHIEKRHRPRTQPRITPKPTLSGGCDRLPSPPPTHFHHFICPTCDRRVLKLFLPLCTRAEATDADTAERWLRALDAHYCTIRKPVPCDLMRHRAQLTNRYGPLFRPERELRCRHCWNIRYGETRPKSPDCSEQSSNALC